MPRRFVASHELTMPPQPSVDEQTDWEQSQVPNLGDIRIGGLCTTRRWDFGIAECSVFHLAVAKAHGTCFDLYGLPFSISRLSLARH